MSGISKPFVMQQCKSDIDVYPVMFKVLFLCSIWGKKDLQSKKLFFDALSLGTKILTSRHSMF